MPLKRQKKRSRRLLAAAILMGVFFLTNWYGKRFFIVQDYQITDARIHDEVRIAVISDLHSSLWGEGQSDLLAAVAEADPHVVLLVGDLFNVHGKNANTLTLLNALSKTFDCYFVLGNHEYKTNGTSDVKAAVASAGIPVLSGSSALIAVGETRVRLFGVDDVHGGEEEQLRQFAGVASSGAIPSIPSSPSMYPTRWNPICTMGSI